MGIFPTLHAQRALTEIDPMVAKMCGRLAHDYDVMTLPIGASFWKGVYTLKVGEPFQYKLARGSSREDVKSFASLIGYTLAGLLPFNNEEGRYNTNPL